MPGQIIQPQYDAQRRFGRAWGMTQPRFPLSIPGTLGFRRERFGWMLFLDLGQHGRELLFEPGMQHRISDRDDAFGAKLSGDRAKEREQFGGPSPLVLMRLQRRVAFRLPRGPWLRDGLVGPSLIFIELRDPSRFRLLV